MADSNEVLTVKIDNIQNSIGDLKTQMTNFTAGIGSKVQEHDKDISVIKNEQENMKEEVHSGFKDIWTAFSGHKADRWKLLAFSLTLIGVLIGIMRYTTQ